MKNEKSGDAPAGKKLERLFIYAIVVFVAIAMITEMTEKAVSVPEAVAETPPIEDIAGDDVAESPKNSAVVELAETPETESFKKIKNISKSEGEELYYPIIVKVSKRYQVDPLLVRAIILAESGFNPKAVSRVGARGLMQLMPTTAKAMGVEDSFNPEHNIDGGVKYLKRLIDRFDGDVKLALAAYNAGSRKVRQYKGVPPYAETRLYISKIYKLMADYKKSIENSEKPILISQT